MHMYTSQLLPLLFWKVSTSRDSFFSLALALSIKFLTLLTMYSRNDNQELFCPVSTWINNCVFAGTEVRRWSAFTFSCSPVPTILLPGLNRADATGIVPVCEDFFLSPSFSSLVGLFYDRVLPVTGGAAVCVCLDRKVGRQLVHGKGLCAILEREVHKHFLFFFST